MCGRFSLRLDRDEIQQLPGHDIDIDEWIDEEEFIPRYNVAPRTQAPVIRRRDPGPSGTGSDSDDHLIMQTMKWGLVPHWSKVEDKSLSTINARSEKLIQGGGMWASIKGKKRCAVPCQGYYEWLTKGKEKLPHFTKRKDGKLLFMAGLYDSVVLEGKTLWTFAVVTTDANKDFSWLHDRQPVFLTNKDTLLQWLDTSSQTWTPELTKIVQPYSDSVALECYQVPKEVGKVGTESPSFIEPITTRKDGIEAMFSEQKQSQPKSSPVKPSAPSAKRKHEASPSPAKAEDSGEGPPRKKHFEPDHGDDSNQPESAKAQANVGGGSSKDDMKSKIRTSPAKRKAVKKQPRPGSKKIDTFFGKS